VSHFKINHKILFFKLKSTFYLLAQQLIYGRTRDIEAKTKKGGEKMNTQKIQFTQGGRTQEELRFFEVMTGSNMCGRCGGTLVTENCLDFRDETGQWRFEAKRCLQCGDLIDPLILKNRLKPSPELIRGRSRRSWRGLQNLSLD
jgi:hypothetical protein